MSADYVTLLGAEKVESAGINMRNAAQEMKSAADRIETALRDHANRMEELLARFQNIMENK